MNRIQSSAPSTQNHGSAPSPQVASALYSPARRDKGYSLFIPLHYEANYAYPLLVWLHGPADDENQLKRIMPLVSMRNYVGVAPRGWPADADVEAAAWPQQAQHVFAAEQRIFAAVQAATCKLNVAPHRVFIGGCGCGGTMALRVALKHPERFAGALSLGGRFPQGMNPLNRITAARRLPIFLATGRESQQYCEHAVCNDLRLLHSAGICVALRIYPCGQAITPDMLGDMDRWMMEIITGAGQQG